jgi:amidase
MSVVTLGQKPPKFDHDAVRKLGSDAGIKINEKHVDDFAVLLGAMDQSIQDILKEDDYVPKPDLDKYPRTDISNKPEDTDKGGWAAKCTAKAASPTNDLLKGKRVALKDNVALAGVKCTNGTEALDWTPEFDATIATRIMDAGATITGKAACENACFEGVSDTSCTGKVHNPYADNYSCGGSSSGSGRLVASGAVDMAIGCDQGGSIRIPSSMCGLVGLKPSWGLVPYTGIISLECTIDHAGPMAKSVPDTARLLEAIAGPDGVDDRQPPFLPEGSMNYIKNVDDFLSTTAGKEKPLAGIKIGVLDEGFTIPGMYDTIASLCRSAVSKLEALGADVKPVSVPTHTQGAIVWMCNVPIAGTRQGFFTDMTGRKQLHMIDRLLASGDPVSQDAFDKLGPGAQNQYLRYLYMIKKYGPLIHAKSSNLLRKLSVCAVIPLYYM